eukprot:358391-Chlamydomonas_euryale.AAC.1
MIGQCNRRRANTHGAMPSRHHAPRRVALHVYMMARCVGTSAMPQACATGDQPAEVRREENGLLRRKASPTGLPHPPGQAMDYLQVATTPRMIAWNWSFKAFKRRRFPTLSRRLTSPFHRRMRRWSCGSC